MKKVLTALITGLTLLVMTGLAQATLITMGTANYMGSDYKLIYDDDDTGYGGGGLVWFDYSHSTDIWQNQVNWASGLGSSLTVTLDPGYTTDIDWETGWRLPDTVEGRQIWGWEGDPDNDGLYSYTEGYNLANSEMGHLYYKELGNRAFKDTENNDQPGWGLRNTGPFDNLIASSYWSSTEHANNVPHSWNFYFYRGGQYNDPQDYFNFYALAVHSGRMDFGDPPPPAPVPEPSTMLLVATGLIGLVGFRKKFKK